MGARRHQPRSHQLDRLGNFDTTARHVAAAVAASSVVVLDGDDPIVAALGVAAPEGGEVAWFGSA